MKEIFKGLFLDGKKTKYIVSTKGSIINNNTGEQVSQFLSGIPQYYYVNILEDDGTRKQRRVHRLVAMVHIPPVEGKNFVDHINRDKLDNNIDNLRWVTRRENALNKDNTKLYLHEGEHYNQPISKVIDSLMLGSEDRRTVYRYLSKDSSIGDCEKMLFKHKRYGGKVSTVTYEGVECYIYDLSMVAGIPYEVFRDRVVNGWSVSEIINGEKERTPLFNVEGVDFYTHREYREYLGIGEDLYNKLKNVKMLSPPEMLEYTPDQDRMVVVEGVLDYLTNHYKRYNTSKEKVRIRRGRGMSIEEALKSKPERVIKYSINGVVKKNKQWYLHYDLDPIVASRYMSRYKCFKTTLEHYGIDTKGLDIKPYTK